MRMRKAQQELMSRRMSHMMQERKKEQAHAEADPKKTEEEDAPMAGVDDEDL